MEKRVISWNDPKALKIQKHSPPEVIGVLESTT